MSLNNDIGQQLPEDEQDIVQVRVERIVKALDTNRAAVDRWFWRGLTAFNLILASLVFWLGIVPRLI